MKSLKEKLKSFIKNAIEFILNPRLFLCLGIAWMITNGWVYIASAISAYFKIGWLGAISAAYLTALWLPLTPEKIITVIIAIFLLRLFFPNDQRTLKKLYDTKAKLIASTKKMSKKRKKKKDLEK